MRLSAEYNFCFIHIPKTGGTSIAQMLDDNISNRHIIRDQSSMSRAHRLARRASLLAIYRKHATALDVYRKCKIYQNLYTFAVVRNPCDWVHSFYKFILYSNVNADTGEYWVHPLYDIVKFMSFADFVDWVTLEHGLLHLPERKRSIFREKTPVLQLDWISNFWGDRIVSDIMKFESINQEVSRVRNKIGIELDSVPHLNKSKSVSKDTIYTREIKQKIENYFDADIKAFGYY